MIKIFHTADIHIGLKFSGKDYPPDLRQRLVAEPMNTLERMVAIANGKKCDLFVVAGDMFDRITAAKQDVKKAAAILNGFQGSSVVVLPGNHDFLEDSPDSIWNTFKSHLSEHLLIFLDGPAPVHTKAGEREIVFYPGPCRTKHSGTNMIEWVKDYPKPEGAVLIGIAHGSVEGLSPDMEQNYFPMTLNQLRQSGVDFWLLGHTHIRYPEVNGTINPLFFMPSTPSPDGFDCSHEGYAWYIEVGLNGSLKYESIRTGSFVFHSWEREVYSAEDIERLKSEALRLDASSTLMKLKLKGRLSHQELKELVQLSSSLSETLSYLETDFTEVTLNIDMDYINRNYPSESLPFTLLSRLAELKDSNLALQLAHQLIEGAKE